jgi:hypothetical protein
LCGYESSRKTNGYSGLVDDGYPARNPCIKVISRHSYPRSYSGDLSLSQPAPVCGKLRDACVLSKLNAGCGVGCTSPDCRCCLGRLSVGHILRNFEETGEGCGAATAMVRHGRKRRTSFGRS